MKIHSISLTLLLLLFLGMGIGTAQEKQAYKIGLVGFYNLENLFDTINDPNTNDEEFLPDGTNQWNTPKYLSKLHNMAYAISTIGTDYTPDGVAVLGLSEIENRTVIEDLVAQPEIADRNYQIVHYNSPDRRGVDVALIYNPKYLKVTSTKSYRTVVPGEPDFITRDQLLVSGLFDGEPMHFIVMHWPSRYGGEKRSMPGRVAAAQLCRHIADSLLASDPNAKVVMMGDLNDYPTNKTITKHLRATGDMKRLREGEFFNPMYELHQKGIGTNYYNDVPGVLDQTILTPALLPTDYSTYQFKNVKVHNKEFLKQHGGRYNGFPFRTFGSGVWMGGYSDHFPVYIILLKKV
ncbi:MAG: endonuclease/exonuclease/phosphatase family protein [Bacteroidales bacterium]|nr:endonuclease/exonuclease/phosphatase family protein [Bacteroidales bacterium]